MRQVFALATAKISQYRAVIIIITMIRKPLVNGFQQQLRSRSSVISPLLKEEKPKIQNERETILYSDEANLIFLLK